MKRNSWLLRCQSEIFTEVTVTLPVSNKPKIYVGECEGHKEVHVFQHVKTKINFISILKFSPCFTGNKLPSRLHYKDQSVNTV